VEPARGSPGAERAQEYRDAATVPRLLLLVTRRI
jgi:hypothetical protein